jgi:hypothetical protein
LQNNKAPAQGADTKTNDAYIIGHFLRTRNRTHEKRKRAKRPKNAGISAQGENWLDRSCQKRASFHCFTGRTAFLHSYLHISLQKLRISGKFTERMDSMMNRFLYIFYLKLSFCHNISLTALKHSLLRVYPGNVILETGVVAIHKKERE